MPPLRGLGCLATRCYKHAVPTGLKTSDLSYGFHRTREAFRLKYFFKSEKYASFFLIDTYGGSSNYAGKLKKQNWLIY